MSMRALIVAAIALVPQIAAAECEKDAVQVGSHLPDLKGALDGNGKAFNVKAAVKTPWTFITVGAQWCAPCKKELPAWDKIAPEFKGKITFVAVNINRNIADGKAFNAKLKLVNMTLVYMNEDKAGSLALTMPTTLVADSKGIVRYAHCGFEKQDVGGEVANMKASLTKLVQ
jgi:thiol-disulfide isomerase/thioredoxin